MDVSQLRCTSCLAPVDPARGAVQRCPYCGATLAVDGSAPVASGTLKLERCGPSIIAVIKVIREHTGLGLKEAKDLAERAPCALLEDADGERIDSFARDLVEVGARVSGAPPQSPFRSAPTGATSSSSVVLESCGPNKIGVIKVIRDHTRCGLKEAKDLAESAPCRITCSADRSDRFRTDLIAAGARAS